MLEVKVVYDELGSSKNGYYNSLLRLTFTGRVGGKRREMTYQFEDKEAVETFKILSESFEELVEKGKKEA